MPISPASLLASFRQNRTLQIIVAIGGHAIAASILVFFWATTPGIRKPYVNRSVLLLDTDSGEFFESNLDKATLWTAPSGKPAVIAAIYGDEHQPLPEPGAKVDELKNHGQFIGYYERVVDGKAEVCATDGKWNWKTLQSAEGMEVINHVTRPSTLPAPAGNPGESRPADRRIG